MNNKIRVMPHYVGTTYQITAIPHVKGYVVQHYIFEVMHGKDKVASRWQVNALEFEAGRSTAYFTSGDEWQLDRLQQLIDHFDSCFKPYHDFVLKEEYKDWHIKELENDTTQPLPATSG
jgi:hypothetical protein